MCVIFIIKTFIAALLAASVAVGPAVLASKVCFNKMAGFDFHWWMQDLNTGYLSDDSTSILIDKTKCMDITIYGMNEADFIETYIIADGGVKEAVDSATIEKAVQPSQLTKPVHELLSPTTADLTVISTLKSSRIPACSLKSKSLPKPFTCYNEKDENIY